MRINKNLRKELKQNIIEFFEFNDELRFKLYGREHLFKIDGNKLVYSHEREFDEGGTGHYVDCEEIPTKEKLIQFVFDVYQYSDSPVEVKYLISFLQHNK